MRKIQLVGHPSLNRLQAPENSLFHAVFEDSPEAIFFLDSNTFKILDCNKKAIELFQADNKPELISMDSFSLYSSEPVEFSKKHFMNEMIGGREFSQELHFRSLKNKTFWGRITQKPVSTHNGTVVLSRIHKVLDYAESSEVLDKLIRKTSKVTGLDFFRTLSLLLAETFEVKYVLIASVTDENFRAETVQFWAGGMERTNFVFELQNSPNFNVVNGYTTYYHKMLPEMFPNYTGFNDLKAESYLGTPVFSREGKVSGMIILMDEKPMPEKPNARNILSVFASRAGAEMERLKMEEQLKQSSDFVNENKTKQKMFQVIAHDLKSPFNTIIGYSDLLRKKMDDYDRGKIIEIIDIIIHSANNCNSLLENLIAWPAVQNGTLNPVIREMDLFRGVQKVVELFEYSALSKNIILKNKISDDFFMKGDETMIMTIMRNLISNAIKFSPHDSEVLISATLVKNEVSISVSDHGCGMSAEEIDHIMKNIPVSTPGTDKETGHGIGFCLSKEFIRLHGGDISIKSKKGAGTKVTFSIPQ